MDPTDFLDAEASLGPGHARGHVLSRAETDALSAVLGAPLDEEARLRLHTAVAMAAEGLIAGAAKGGEPWRELERAFHRGSGVETATAMLDDPDIIRRAAAGVLFAELNDGAPAIAAGDLAGIVAAARAAEQAGAAITRAMAPGRGRPTGGQLFGLQNLSAVAAHVAKRAGASTALPSNQAPEVGTALTDFVTAVVEKAIVTAAAVAAHRFSAGEAESVSRIARCSAPSPRTLSDWLRSALRTGK